MRVLLDANISGKVALPLHQLGHDVLAVAESPELQKADDEELLRLAREQGRIVVTFDVGDFVDLATRFTASEGGHSGCLLVSSTTFRSSEFGAIARALDTAFKIVPLQNDWQDRVSWLTRA